jgi:hypothetical protein
MILDYIGFYRRLLVRPLPTVDYQTPFSAEGGQSSPRRYSFEYAPNLLQLVKKSCKNVFLLRVVPRPLESLGHPMVSPTHFPQSDMRKSSFHRLTARHPPVTYPVFPIRASMAAARTELNFFGY